MNLRDDILDVFDPDGRLAVSDINGQRLAEVDGAGRIRLTRIAEEHQTMLLGEDLDTGRQYTYGLRLADNTFVYPTAFVDPIDLHLNPKSTWGDNWGFIRWVMERGWKVALVDAMVTGEEDHIQWTWPSLDETGLWALEYLRMTGHRSGSKFHSSATSHRVEDWLTSLGVKSQSGEPIKTGSRCLAGLKHYGLSIELPSRRSDGGKKGYHTLTKLFTPFLDGTATVPDQIALFRKELQWSSKRGMHVRSVRPHNYARIVRQGT